MAARPPASSSGRTAVGYRELVAFSITAVVSPASSGTNSSRARIVAKMIPST